MARLRRTAAAPPLPAYSEDDVKEVTRAFTDWRVDWRRELYRYSFFEPWMHDS
jgi:hypothetical protein